MAADVTQEHVDLITKIAHNLAGTAWSVTDADELESEAMVVLWDLALAWEPDQCPFGAFVAMFGRRRLIDWLRHTYGREGNGNSDARWVFAHPNAIDDGQYDCWADNAPLPERVILAREELAEVVGHVRDICSEREADALLWSLPGEPAERDHAACRRKWGMSRNSAQAHRSHAKRLLVDTLAS